MHVYLKWHSGIINTEEKSPFLFRSGYSSYTVKQVGGWESFWRRWHTRKSCKVGAMEDAIVGNRDFLKGQILGMVGRSWTSESREEVLGKSNSGESGSSPRDAAGWGWQSGVETKSIR